MTRLDRVTAVLDALRQHGSTVATAESLTAGLLCVVLTEVSGASEVVRGGLVVYATELKTELADVGPDLLAEHGPVHPAVAMALAKGAQHRCGADWGIGLTGVAGPGPQGGIAAGTVHLGFAGPRDVTVRSEQCPGDRQAVRGQAVELALEHFEGLLRWHAE